MAESRIRQPPWHEPISEAPDPTLKIYNTMTRTKVEFEPMMHRRVKWYNCGPTVYDASHLGHARNYVSQDIIRRILSDYFGYDVQLVMNITDIDDKIIIRGRQQYLFEEYKDSVTSFDAGVIDIAQRAFSNYLRNLAKSLPPGEAPAHENDEAWHKVFDRIGADPAWYRACAERDEKFVMHHKALKCSADALITAQRSGLTDRTTAYRMLNASYDTIAPYLDLQRGATATDPAIFRKLTTYWEGAFMSDMQRLHVQPPDILTRVTEYLPEITAFVERIIGNGFAYSTADGSVYFDTREFDGTRRGQMDEDDPEWHHSYAKLMPWAKGNWELLAEGEGSLGTEGFKRGAADFALWKASKPGEPSWPSPWGPGRPGWHIECSVMASEILGSNMDIHSGGADLMFPHHDNELAQSEAYHDCPQWVNYFIHTGHLHIEGLKMSKSLKNFITIEQALKKYTARQLRLFFLSQLWSSKIDFRESSMIEMKTMENGFDNFFNVTKALVAESQSASAGSGGHNRFGLDESALTELLHQAQADFRAALCDSFNTPEALSQLTQLASQTNVYLGRGRANINVSIVRNVALWITKMLRMFGLGEGPVTEGAIGWGSVSEGEDGAGIDKETVLMPYLRALSTFRDDVRQLAIAKAPASEILARSDRLRDLDLAPLGVALDDQDDGRALVKLVNPAVLLRAREEKAAAAAAKDAKRAAQIEAEAAKRHAKAAKARIPPSQMFQPPYVPEGTYGSWNDQGLPLTDGTGLELPKSRAKKLAKEWEIQAKLHREFLDWSNSQAGPST